MVVGSSPIAVTMELLIFTFEMTGYQENVSAPRFHLPGSCCMENSNDRVFSLNLVICGFVILANLFLKIPVTGL